MMATRFHNDEQSYRRWLRHHRQGFVFNHFTGNNPWENLIHRRDCDHLWRPEHEGRRTAVEKWCSDDQRDLETKATELRGPEGWKRCADCM